MKPIIRLHLFIIFILISTTPMAQQRMVKSNLYNIMLKTLLHHTVAEISADTLKKYQAQVVLLDARKKEEFDVSHIQNAHYVGYEDFDEERVKNIDKNAQIVVYCSVGYRSEKVSEKLKAAGYMNISNLYGGIFEWKNKNNPVFNDGGQTNKVHGFSKSWAVWLHNADKVYKP